MSRERYSMSRDEEYMSRAIELAKKADGMTSPNPMVGAVIVKDGRIIAEGYHRRAGLPHAEVNAIRRAGEKADGATLYVTLEPCDHFGRTPPCTDAIVKSGLKKVVIGMRDPNSCNDGRGMKKLRLHGINAKCGILEEACRSMNKPYIKFVTKRIPYVTIKIAQSIDGKIATSSGESKWITSDESRSYARKLRAKMDAVMVGVNTVISDNPSLTSRIPGSREPMRVIVDSRLRTPLNAKIFSSLDISPVLIATTKNSRRVLSYERKGVNVLITKSKYGKVDLKDLTRRLGALDVTHVLVEGGGELIAGILEERLADNFFAFIAPKIIGGKRALTSVEGKGVARIKDAARLKGVTIKKLGDDILIEGDLDQCSPG